MIKHGLSISRCQYSIGYTTQVEKEKTLTAVDMRRVHYLIITMTMLWGALSLTSLEFLYG